MKLLYLVESGESKFLVFDEMPDKISTKYGDDTIIGRIGGIFYDFLAKRNERREAFGGRKFDIVLDNGEIEKCEGQWWDAATDRAREELEKEGNPLSKMVLIGVSSVDRLLDCYVYYGLWASESKIEEMIADYKGRIYEMLNIESFSLRYLPHLVWDGIQFCGWLWDGSRPVKRATRELLRICKIYGGEVTFVDYSGNEYYAEHFRRFYQTAEQCRKANKPKIVMLDEEYDFKPFDKVLVRKEGNKKWNISLFAREIVDDYNGLPYKYECSNGTLWDYCIHFEGNECLLGTTENPEK